MKQYYISNNDQPQGPFALEELAAHGLNADSMIWHEEMTDWRPVSAVAAVQALLPKLPPPLLRSPPPLNNSSAIHNPPFPTAPLPLSPPIAKPTTQLAGANNKRRWAMVGSAIVLVIILIMGFNHNRTSNTWTETSPAMEAGGNDNFTGNNSSVAQAVQAQQAAAETQRIAAETQRIAAETQKAAEAEQREAKRAWNKKHFLEYVDTEILPGYTYRLIGGISTGYCRFTNKSGYKLQNVIVDIAYIKSNGETYATKQVYVDNLAARSSATMLFPSCERGVRVIASINHFEAHGLEYIYDVQGQEDAMMAEADARAAEEGGY